MIMGRIKKALSPEPLQVCSIKLTPTAADLLDDLSQRATDTIGRPVTTSTLIRVILQYIEQQTPAWTAKTLYPLIEQEIERGRVWGKKKQV